AEGCKRLLVQTPSFTVDCLETLEEISEELKEDFIKAGGESFKQVPCLNDNKDWIRDFSSLVASGQLAKPITLELE
ncbi:MAG: ferrochelatase, partial [Pseudobdellovibrio sp.]